MDEQKYRKVYIDVITEMRRDGTVIPLRFVWEDDRRYKIDRVRHITPAASLKVGGRGMRYTVVINGQERYFFREDDRWFVEAPALN